MNLLKNLTEMIFHCFVPKNPRKGFVTSNTSGLAFSIYYRYNDKQHNINIRH
jgi:hypothetical protein